MFVPRFTPRFAIAAAALLSIGLAAQAGATEYEANGRKSAVRHADLDLSKAADQAVLARRVASAVNRVCASRNLAEWSACRAETKRRMEAPMAQAIARAKSTERYAEARAIESPIAGN